MHASRTLSATAVSLYVFVADKIALLTRLSAIPGHVTTAVFATVGMGFWVFFLAAVFSLPKFLSVVYLGSVIESQGQAGQGSGSRGVQLVVIAAITVVTLAIGVYIWRRMDAVKPQVQQAMQQERYRRLKEAASYVGTGQAGAAECIEMDTPGIMRLGDCT